MKEKKPASLISIIILEIIILLLAGTVMFYANLDNAEKHQKSMLPPTAMSLLMSYSEQGDGTFIEYYSDRMKCTADTIAYLASMDDSINADNIGTLASQFGVSSIVMGTPPGSDGNVAEDSLFWHSPEDEGSTMWFTSDKINGTQVSIMIENDDIYSLSDPLLNLSKKYYDDVGASCTYLLMDSATGDLILWPDYTPGEPQSASSLGFDAAAVPPEQFGWATINGEEYYAYNYPDEARGINLIVGVEEDMLTGNALSATALMVLIMAVILILVTAFSYYTVQEDRFKQKKDTKKDDITRRKIISAGAVGIIAVAIAAFSVQTLFSISIGSMMISEAHGTIAYKQFSEELKRDTFTDACDSICSQQTELISYALSSHPELRTREGLTRLSDRLGMDFVMLLDLNGKEIASDSSIVGYSLPKSEKDSNAYALPFNDLLKGAQFRSVDLADEVFGKPVRLSGMPVRNEKNEVDSIILAAAPGEVLNELLENPGISGIVAESAPPLYMEVLDIDYETHEFRYPDFDYIADIKDYGLTEDQIKADYWGAVNRKYFDYYTGSKMYGNDVILISIPFSEMFEGRNILTALISLLFIVSLLLVWLFFKVFDVREIAPADSKDYIDIEMADGGVKSTRRVLDRIFGTDINEDSYAGEKTIKVWRMIQLVIVVIVMLVMIFRLRLMTTGSLFGFMLEGKWERGLNVFAFTVMLTVIILYLVVMWVFNSVMHVLISLANPRNETFLRLVRSCVRYLTVIALIFYCMTLAGIDSTALLASAGLLTLIVGLGAQTLITDILAGLFIIFEHDFQVGDIIEVNGFRGRVVEIGIRSTRVIDAQQNIKTINNRNLTDVINRTSRTTVFYITIPVRPDQDIVAIERMLEEELPKLSTASPHIISGPNYNGIERITTLHMYLSFRTECSEEYRYSTMTIMNREITKLFKEHGFRIGQIQ